MAESYRLHVLKKLCDHLRNITPENGYEYDLRCSVYRGRMEFGENDTAPLLSIIEATTPGPGEYVGYNGQARSLEWPLFIQGWIDNDQDNPGDPAYGLMAAVEVQLARLFQTAKNGKPQFPEEYLLGIRPGKPNPLITKLTTGPGVVRQPANQVSSHAFFFLPIWVGLAEEMGNPYVNPTE